jgi:hypothetical protein
MAYWPNQGEQIMPQPSLAWSFLADGTALFFGQRTACPEKNLDYFRLAEMVFKELSSRTAEKAREIGRFLSATLFFCAQAGRKEA